MWKNSANTQTLLRKMPNKLKKSQNLWKDGHQCLISFAHENGPAQ